MITNRIRVLWCVAMLIVAGSVAITGARAQSAIQHADAPAASAAGPKKAEEQFKNIQVLKGIPADQLLPTMEFISASLGVHCDHCHVQKAFDKDDKKPKQIARKMIEMMITINQENFDANRKVTCNTCHRGNIHPVAIPAVMTEDAKPPEPPKPAGKEEEAKKSTPTADQLLDQYLQAVGGSAAIDKVTTRVMKGKIDFSGMSFPIDIYCKDPEQRISFTHTPDGESVTAFNGHEGWLSMSGGQVREMHGSELDAASIDADIHLATHLKQMFTQMQVRGAEKIGDHEVYVVVGQREGKPPIELYFDQQSGLLLRLVRYADTALGLLPTQIDYADYHEDNGVKIPYRWTLARPNGRFTIQVSEVKQNVPVDDAKFVKPNPPQTSPAGPSK